MNLSEHLRRLSILVLTIMASSFGAITFTQRPQDLQLYPRNPQTDSGTVTIAGSTASSSVTVKVYRNGTLIGTQTQNVVGGVFSIACKIKAELALYKFEAYEGANTTPSMSADSVVCGDVYIIQGQSNASAGMNDGSANGNQSPYIRTFGDYWPDSTWYLADGDLWGGDGGAGGIGQWGIKMARNIVDTYKYPVAVINGAAGGQPISYFQKSNPNDEDGNPLPAGTLNNYRQLLFRLKASGLQADARVIIWFQGEANPGDAVAEYKTAFTTLRGSWLADYPGIKKIYIFQVHVDHPVREAQRELAMDLPNTGIMSTSAQTPHTDGAHFPYVKGYEDFGNNIYRLIARDLYGSTDTANIEAPAIQSAAKTGDKEITMYMKQVHDSIRWVSGSEARFNLVGNSATVVSGRTSGNKIILTMSASAAGATAITYSGLEKQPDPLVLNLRGVGALMFEKFPIGAPPVAVNSHEHQRALGAPSVRTGDYALIAMADGPHAILLTDAQGRIVRRTTGSSAVSIDLKGFDAGYYVVSAKQGAGLQSLPMIIAK